MRISINLLPPEKKEALEKRQKLKLIVWQEMMLFFIVIIFLMILGSINLILKIQLEGIQNISESEKAGGAAQELEKFEGDFRRINSQIGVLHNIWKNDLHWSRFFKELNDVVDESVALHGLTTKNFQVFISGRANSRDDLLKLQEKINASPCFAEANIPLSNLVTKDNVDFQIDFKIKDECIKNSQ